MIQQWQQRQSDWPKHLVGFEANFSPFHLSVFLLYFYNFGDLFIISVNSIEIMLL